MHRVPPHKLFDPGTRLGMPSESGPQSMLQPAPLRLAAHTTLAWWNQSARNLQTILQPGLGFPLLSTGFATADGSRPKDSRYCRRLAARVL
eukprot:351442-Chlamydomonas_euryale.AAC.3